MNGYTSSAVKNVLRSTGAQSRETLPLVRNCIAGPSRRGVAPRVTSTASFHTGRINRLPPPAWPSAAPRGSRFGDYTGPGRGALGSTSWIDEPSRLDAAAQEPQVAQRPSDEDITSEFIRLIDANGKLQPGAVPLKDVLASMDRERYSLRQITTVEELEKKQAKDPNFTPLVRMFELEAIAERNQAAKDKAAAAAAIAPRQKKQKRKAAPSSEYKGPPHEVNLSWSTTPHDMRHKLKQAKKFLTKKGSGAKVKLVVVTKSGKKYESGTHQEKEEFIRVIEEEVTGQQAGAEVVEETDSSDGELRIRRNGDIVWVGGVIKATAEVEFVAV